MPAHEEALARGQQALEDAAATLPPCPWRPAYHFTAPAGWINDPNGFVHFRGHYHLFYQHYPYAAKWGPMHWGHAISTDLLHWRHLPIALAPSEPYDLSERACGCWSGSAIDADGKLALIYTGHSESFTPRETQNLATSDDGIHFTKHPANPVIAQLPPEASHDFRDPKVWRHGEHYYVVIGSGKDGVGKVLLYRSPDLVNWTCMGVMAQSDGTLGAIWECPDLFHLDGKDVLIFSPTGLGRPLSMYLVGTLDYETGRFTAESHGLIDHGSDFYAPQTTAGPDGRRLLIGWMQAWGANVPTEANGWNGAMTLPRELRLRDGVLLQQPIPELASIRREPAKLGSFDIPAGSWQKLPVAGGTCELSATLRGNAPAIRVRASSDGKQYTEIRWDRAAGKISIDRTHAGAGDKGVFSADIAANTPELPVRIFIDRSSVELFTADGAVVLTCRVYPDSGSDAIFLSSGRFADVTLWHIEP